MCVKVLSNRREAIEAKQAEVTSHRQVFGDTAPSVLARLEAEKEALENESNEVSASQLGLDGELETLAGSIGDLLAAGPDCPLIQALAEDAADDLRLALTSARAPPQGAPSEGGKGGEASPPSQEKLDGAEAAQPGGAEWTCTGVRAVVAAVDTFLAAMEAASESSEAEDLAAEPFDGDSSSLVGRIIGAMASPFRAKRKRGDDE